MPQYPQEGGAVKLAAGWLIEQSGWKGHSRDPRVHDKQALVLVHFGGATGEEVWALAQDVMASVHESSASSWSPRSTRFRCARVLDAPLNEGLETWGCSRTPCR